MSLVLLKIANHFSAFGMRRPSVNPAPKAVKSKVARAANSKILIIIVSFCDLMCCVKSMRTGLCDAFSIEYPPLLRSLSLTFMLCGRT